MRERAHVLERERVSEREQKSEFVYLYYARMRAGCIKERERRANMCVCARVSNASYGARNVASTLGVRSISPQLT